jgi:hypothetical protein
MTASLRPKPLLILALILVVAIAVLWAMGRPPICTCGEIDLWVGAADSPRTSQMLADWYSPSHIIHGVLFYAALWWIVRSLSVEWRLLIAALVETAWELLENTPWAIQHYREATIAIGYTGDSILNTFSDIMMMVLGFFLARKLPVWASAAIIVVLELAALAAIRDNLTLNVWMFLAPNDAIKAWQAG